MYGKYRCSIEIAQGKSEIAYRLHHDVKVGTGFTQPRAKGLRIA